MVLNTAVSNMSTLETSFVISVHCAHNYRNIKKKYRKKILYLKWFKYIYINIFKIIKIIKHYTNKILFCISVHCTVYTVQWTKI